ncbi:MAG: hypothetical protein WBN90_13660, partial [Gammaproteobacteria bacterium]
MKHAPCLSFRAQRECEWRMRRFSREAQGTRAAGCAFGPPFFWILFFGGAKKSISPAGAKARIK